MHIRACFAHGLVFLCSVLALFARSCVLWIPCNCSYCPVGLRILFDYFATATTWQLPRTRHVFFTDAAASSRNKRVALHSFATYSSAAWYIPRTMNVYVRNLSTFNSVGVALWYVTRSVGIMMHVDRWCARRSNHCGDAPVRLLLWCKQ